MFSNNNLTPQKQPANRLIKGFDKDPIIQIQHPTPTSHSNIPAAITSTPILPKPNFEYLKGSCSLSTKRQTQRSRLTDDRAFIDDGSKNKLGSSFLLNGCSFYSTPPSPIKNVAPQSRVFPRPRLDRARVVSFQSDQSCDLSSKYDDKSPLEYFEQCFEVEEKIGEGSFGEVFKVKSKDDGQYYAVKRSRGAFRGSADRKEKISEVAKYEKLAFHPNCVQFYLAWEEKRHLYIQTELCLTSLHKLVSSEGGDDCLPERLIWSYLLDLLRAIQHLHVSDLIHFDIKPENVFVARVNGSDVCKLGDFGLVKDVGLSNLEDAQEGDPKYLAPEILKGHFSKAADVFSLGMTLLELATGLDLPSNGEAWHMLRSGQWLPKEFMVDHLSRGLQEILKQMLDPDPLTRPTVDQLLHMPAIIDVEKQKRRHHLLGRLKLIIRQFALFVLFLIVMFWTHCIRQPFILIATSIFRVNITPKSVYSRSSSNQSHHTSDQCADNPSKKPLTNHSSGFLIDASFSDDDVFEDKLTHSSKPLMNSFRNSISDVLKSASSKTKTPPKTIHNSFQNSSANSSILAAPLNNSLSPKSDRSNSSLEEFNVSSRTRNLRQPSTAGGVVESMSFHDLETYEGATPPPKRHSKSRISSSEGNCIFSTVSGGDVQRTPASAKKQLTPNHLISDSPFKAPLSMSTPRQKVVNLKNQAKVLNEAETSLALKPHTMHSEDVSLCSSRSSEELLREAMIPCDLLKTSLNYTNESLSKSRLEDGQEWRLFKWLNNTSFDEEGDLQVDVSSSVEPKNLLSLFDSVSEDDLVDPT